MREIYRGNPAHKMRPRARYFFQGDIPEQIYSLLFENYSLASPIMVFEILKVEAGGKHTWWWYDDDVWHSQQLSSTCVLHQELGEVTWQQFQERASQPEATLMEFFLSEFV